MRNSCAATTQSSFAGHTSNVYSATSPALRPPDQLLGLTPARRPTAWAPGQYPASVRGGARLPQSERRGIAKVALRHGDIKSNFVASLSRIADATIVSTPMQHNSRRRSRPVKRRRASRKGPPRMPRKVRMRAGPRNTTNLLCSNCGDKSGNGV